MGGDDNDRFNSGWAGRYLDATYPGYPDNYPSSDMPDPIALEIGSRVSLAFHRADGVPIALAVDNPEQFHRLTSGGGALPTDVDTGSYYGQALDYVMGVEQKASQYAQRLQNVYQRGNNQVGYPERYHGTAPAVLLETGCHPSSRRLPACSAVGVAPKYFWRASTASTRTDNKLPRVTPRGEPTRPCCITCLPPYKRSRTI